MKVRNFCDRRSGNRFIRLDAPNGLVSINYRARVHLHTESVPLQYLMPSRYANPIS